MPLSRHTVPSLGITCRTSCTMRCGVGGNRFSVARSAMRLRMPSRKESSAPAVPSLPSSRSTKNSKLVQHGPILTARPPQPVLRSPDHQTHFVEVPFVARAGEPAPDLVGEALAELARSLAHGLVAHVDA